MNTRSVFEKRLRLAPVGVREWRLGPWRLRWGGGWYLIGPLSLLRMQQLLDLAGLLDPAKAARMATAESTALLRPFLPLLVDGDLNPRHLRRASPRQVEDLCAAWYEANDMQAILIGFARLALAGLTVDRLCIKLGAALHCWPAEIIHQPAQAVFTVADELGLLGPPFQGNTSSTTTTNDNARQPAREGTN